MAHILRVLPYNRPSAIGHHHSTHLVTIHLREHLICDLNPKSKLFSQVVCRRCAVDCAVSDSKVSSFYDLRHFYGKDLSRWGFGRD